MSDLSMSQFANAADYWKARAEAAEALAVELERRFKISMMKNEEAIAQRDQAAEAYNVAEARAVEATRYAERLAVSLARHYPEAPQWRPLSGDLLGLLTQIDNATAGLGRHHAAETRAGEAEREVADLVHDLERAMEGRTLEANGRIEAERALQGISMTLGGSDEWTDQRQMIADVERQVEEVKARADEAEPRLRAHQDAIAARNDEIMALRRMNTVIRRELTDERARLDKAERRLAEAREALDVSYMALRFCRTRLKHDAYRARLDTMVLIPPAPLLDEPALVQSDALSDAPAPLSYDNPFGVELVRLSLDDDEDEVETAPPPQKGPSDE